MKLPKLEKDRVNLKKKFYSLQRKPAVYLLNHFRKIEKVLQL
jgi:hypothetical protein